MKHLLAIAAGITMMLLCTNAGAQAKRYYDTTIDPIAQIDAAVKHADVQGKNVICQVGGDWCRWCIMFAKFITADGEISKTIADNYVYIHVNYDRKGGDNNRKVAERLNNPGRFGFPVLVVLDRKGNVIHIQDSSFLEEGEGYNREKVMRFLNAWTPEAVKL